MNSGSSRLPTTTTPSGTSPRLPTFWWAHPTLLTLTHTCHLSLSFHRPSYEMQPTGSAIAAGGPLLASLPLLHTALHALARAQVHSPSSARIDVNPAARASRHPPGCPTWLTHSADPTHHAQRDLHTRAHSADGFAGWSGHVWLCLASRAACQSPQHTVVKFSNGGFRLVVPTRYEKVPMLPRHADIVQRLRCSQGNKADAYGGTISFTLGHSEYNSLGLGAQVISPLCGDRMSRLEYPPSFPRPWPGCERLCSRLHCRCLPLSEALVVLSGSTRSPRTIDPE